MYLKLISIVMTTMPFVAADDVVESCFLYPVSQTKQTEVSPAYSFPGNKDVLHVSIDCIFKVPTFTQLIDENGHCIVGIRHHHHHSEGEEEKCQVEFNSTQDYTGLKVHRRGNEAAVAYQNDPSKEPILTSLPEKIVVKSSNAVNVAFDCPQRCFEFENILFHKSYQQLSHPYDLRIYGRIIDPKETYDPSVNIRFHADWQRKRNIPLQSLKLTTDQWYFIDIAVSFTVQIGALGRDFVGAMTFSNPLLKDYIIGRENLLMVSKDLYLDFWNSSNVRWSEACGPAAHWGSIPGGLHQQNKTDVIILSIVVAILSIIIILMCISLRKEIKKGLKASRICQVIIQKFAHLSPRNLKPEEAEGEEGGHFRETTNDTLPKP